MIDIRDIEESILIETNDFNWPLKEVITLIAFRNPDMTEDEVYQNTSDIVSALVIEGYISIVRTSYRHERENTYSPLKEIPYSTEEALEFLKNHGLWNKAGAFSYTHAIEMKITDQGVERLKETA